MPKWIKIKDTPPIYTGKVYGFEIKEQVKRGYKTPFQMLYGSYNNKGRRYKIMVYVEKTW